MKTLAFNLKKIEKKKKTQPIVTFKSKPNLTML